ncbi:MAG: retroviral-like aspartic protease [Armatimonadetes bacterium]|nr:retroviral-like aspartic protease [Armatimonadota bacterium]
MLESGLALREIRLLAEVTLIGVHGSLAPTSAIVDTGSPVSAIPRREWRHADYRILWDTEVPLSMAGSEVMAKLACVKLGIHDRHITSPLLEVRAYLMPDDSHPFLLGSEDFLTDVDLHVSFARQSAYLEFLTSRVGG